MLYESGLLRKVLTIKFLGQLRSRQAEVMANSIRRSRIRDDLVGSPTIQKLIGVHRETQFGRSCFLRLRNSQKGQGGSEEGEAAAPEVGQKSPMIVTDRVTPRPTRLKMPVVSQNVPSFQSPRHAPFATPGSKRRTLQPSVELIRTTRNCRDRPVHGVGVPEARTPQYQMLSTKVQRIVDLENRNQRSKPDEAQSVQQIQRISDSLGKLLNRISKDR